MPYRAEAALVATRGSMTADGRRQRLGACLAQPGDLHQRRVREADDASLMSGAGAAARRAPKRPAQRLGQARGPATTRQVRSRPRQVGGQEHDSLPRNGARRAFLRLQSRTSLAGGTCVVLYDRAPAAVRQTGRSAGRAAWQAHAPSATRANTASDEVRADWRQRQPGACDGARRALLPCRGHGLAEPHAEAAGPASGATR